MSTRPKMTAILYPDGSVEWRRTGGVYSEEAIAERRLANRLRYLPSAENPRTRKRIKPEVNNVTELPF